MSAPTRWACVLGALLVAVAVALDAWHAHGLREALAAPAWEAVGRAIRQQELAGGGLFLAGLLPARGVLAGLVRAAFLVAALLFAGAIYARHLAGWDAAGALAPFGGGLHILAWLMLAGLAARRSREAKR